MKTSIQITQTTEDDYKAFTEFKEGSGGRGVPRLRYTPQPYPHEEIAVLVQRDLNEPNMLHAFAKHHNMNLSRLGDVCVLSQHIPAEDVNGVHYVFSGNVIHDGKFIFGMDELVNENISSVDLRDDYGEFSMVTVSNNSVELSADFFGMAQWYYFDNDDVFAASNNYHMLLLVLSACGVTLSMDVERSCVSLITAGWMFSTTPSKKLDVDFCKMNLPYERLRFDLGNRLTIEKTELFDLVSSVEKWDEDVYESYVRAAKAEIAENVHAVFVHDRFDTVVIDLSGGFDSRVVFAIACGLPKKLRSKIKIQTSSGYSADDIDIAASINNVFGYDFVSMNDDEYDEILQDGWINFASISRNLGVRNEPAVCGIDYKTDRVINLCGGVGDAVLGYRRATGGYNYSSPRVFADFSGSPFKRSIEGLEEVFTLQDELLRETLDAFSWCDDLVKKVNNYYLCFRNRSHFKNNMPRRGLIRTNVLFSKYALKAKWMYFNRFQNNTVPSEKLSIDLLTMIDPLFSAIPFCRENDNDLPRSEDLLNTCNIKLELDKQIKNVKPLENYGSKSSEKTYIAKCISYYMDLDLVREMLCHLVDYSVEYRNVAIAYFRLLSEIDKNPLEKHSKLIQQRVKSFIINVYNAYYQIAICEGNGDIL